jgi:hypothetical protein
VVDETGRIRLIPSPDVTVWWGHGIATHHEIKHKNATTDGYFGLEEYRVNSLLEFMQKTGQEVYYTIHDHDKSGGRHATANDIKHWIALSLDALVKGIDKKRLSPSYRNGQKSDEMTYYWERSRFSTLEEEFDNLSVFSRPSFYSTK